MSEHKTPIDEVHKIYLIYRATNEVDGDDQCYREFWSLEGVYADKERSLSIVQKWECYGIFGHGYLILEKDEGRIEQEIDINTWNNHDAYEGFKGNGTIVYKSNKT